MHVAVCPLRAGQPRSAGDVAKLDQFISQFSWVTGDPIGLKGLMAAILMGRPVFNNLELNLEQEHEKFGLKINIFSN